MTFGAIGVVDMVLSLCPSSIVRLPGVTGYGLRKPRIVRRNGQWLCDDIAYGDTPMAAYLEWKDFMRASEVMLRTTAMFR